VPLISVTEGTFDILKVSMVFVKVKPVALVLELGIPLPALTFLPLAARSLTWLGLGV
jgi:hypothetical protein